MVRGHMKMQAREKNRKKQEANATKQPIVDIKTACAQALKFKCSICMTPCKDVNSFKIHFETKHPKAPLPAELTGV